MQQPGRKKKRGEGGYAIFHNKVKPGVVRLVPREDSPEAEPRNLKSILLI